MNPGVVLDTSVVVNLLASGHPETILRALGVRRVIVAVTSREILRHPLDTSRKGDPMAPLIEAGVIEQIPLDPAAQPRFMELVGAVAPDGLGDGEAAALACGELLMLPVALDETKGRRVAQQKLPGVRLVCSGAIFLCPAVKAALGTDLGDAVYSALVHARMRILAEHDSAVRKLIGDERANQCPSLRRRGIPPPRKT
jgi:hypothetical protein